jgi:hypothetical protein
MPTIKSQKVAVEGHGQVDFWCDAMEVESRSLAALGMTTFRGRRRDARDAQQPAAAVTGALDRD